MANENTKIFSEAIAEAKAIRETAMQNAKLALEEAFTPRIQEMMNNKLASLAEDEEEIEERFTGKNGEMTSNDGDETDSMEEISLEELLAELEGLEEEDGYSSYSKDKGTNVGFKKLSIDPGVDDPYMEENEIFEAEDDDTVAEITVDDLKDIIRDVVADLLGGPEEEESGEGEGEPGHEEGETPEEEAGEGEEELSLEEILAELEEDMDPEEVENSMSMATNEELEEAMSTITQLRSELNEVNLLNAKLLYVNKLFKSKNLTEAQKVKVINAFDRAETVKETKNIFETLQESLTATQAKKNPIKESLSFASKPAGIADRKPIVENNDFVARMQKLAGII
jgi:hypothetical protein